MKFIVDECTGMAVAEIMPQAEDHTILTKAVKEGRILITNDKDFGELIFRRGLFASWRTFPALAG